MILENKKLLFFDPALLEENQGVTLRVCPPRDRQIVLEGDKPWETAKYITLYVSVVYDNGVYKMYYTHNNDDEENFTGLLYAESTDGYNWTKPELGLVSYKGSKANNMIGILANEGCVIFEPDAPEEERYKCFMDHLRKGTFLHTSADGIHWKLSDKKLGDFLLDSQNAVFYDERIGKYAQYMRGWTIPANGGKHVRTVVRTETDDLNKPFEYDKSLTKIHRSDGLPTISNGEFPVVFAADEYDGDVTDVYTMIPSMYDGYYIAFPSFYRHEPGEPIEGSLYHYKNDGRLEVMFAGSLDGIKWHRYDRSPYISNDISGRFKSNMVFMGTGWFRVGDSIRQYGTLFRTKHGEVHIRVDNKKGDGKIVCYEQRVDGFVCAHFDYKGGKIMTCPWVCSGKDLIINLDAGMCGRVKVGLCNEDGTPIEGFTTDDCQELTQNGIDVKVNFAGGDLQALVGKKVKVVIEGANAKVFSLRFE